MDFWWNRHFRQKYRKGLSWRRKARGWRRGDWGWSSVTWIGCENVFLAQDRRGGGGWSICLCKGQRSGETQQRRPWVKRSLWGTASSNRRGNTTDEEKFTWLMSSGSGWPKWGKKKKSCFFLIYCNLWKCSSPVVILRWRGTQMEIKLLFWRLFSETFSWWNILNRSIFRFPDWPYKAAEVLDKFFFPVFCTIWSIMSAQKKLVGCQSVALFSAHSSVRIN